MKKKSKYMKPKLEMSSRLKARRQFKINGHIIEGGQPFDWRRLSIGWRRVVQLYEARIIVIDEQKEAPAAPEAKEPVVTQAAPIIPPIVETPPAPPETPIAPPVEQTTEGGNEQPEETPDVPPAPPEVSKTPEAVTETEPVVNDITVHHRGGGWYDVLKNGTAVNEKPIRKDDAEILAASLK